MRIENELGNLLIEMLLRDGYFQMSAENKNMLVTYLAEKNNMLLTDIDTDFILQTVKDIKIEELSKTCNDTIEKGFVATNGHKYRTNRDDQINMMGEKDRLDNDPSVDIVQWKTEDIGYIPHSREEWLGIYHEGLEFKRKQLMRYNYLKMLVLNAKGEMELINIKWDMPVKPSVVEEVEPTVDEEEVEPTVDEILPSLEDETETPEETEEIVTE